MKVKTIIICIIATIIGIFFYTFYKLKISHDSYFYKNQLVWAIGNGDIAKIKKLINDGHDVNQISVWKPWGSSSYEGSDTPLTKACKRGNVEIVDTLIANGANVNIADGFGLLPIDRAVEFKSYEVLKLLLKKGSNTYSFGKEILLATNDETIIEIFLSFGVGRKLPHGELFYSCLEGRFQIVKWMLNNGVAVDSSPSFASKEFESECFPIHAAAKSGRIEIIEMLLQFGADINMKSKQKQYTPLMFVSNKAEVIDFMIENGADPTLVDIFGNNSLHKSIEASNTNLAIKLLSNTNLIDTQNNQQETPMHIALKLYGENQIKICKTIAEFNPNLKLVDANGRSPEKIISEIKNEKDKTFLKATFKLNQKRIYNNISQFRFAREGQK